MENTIETYEQRVEREKSEKLALIEERNKRFAAIVKLLGLTLKRDKDTEPWNARTVGLTPDGGEVWLTSGEWRVGLDRLSVSARYPRYTTGGYVEVYEQVEKTRTDGTKYQSRDAIGSPIITISLKKTNEQIVKDIKSRFIPGFQKKLTAVIAKIKETNERDAKNATAIDRLKLVLTGKGADKTEIENNSFTHYPKDDELYSNRIEVKLQGAETVEITVRAESVDQAAAILKAFKKIVA